MSKQFTIIGHCQNIADNLEAEAARWAAMAKAMGIAYQKLEQADRVAVQELLNRISVESTGEQS